MSGFVWDFSWYERDLMEAIRRTFPRIRVMERTEASVCEIPIVLDPTMPPNRVDFVNEKGETIGRIENIGSVNSRVTPEGET